MGFKSAEVQLIFVSCWVSANEAGERWRKALSDYRNCGYVSFGRLFAGVKSEYFLMEQA